jgi:hypothetical protein
MDSSVDEDIHLVGRPGLGPADRRLSCSASWRRIHKVQRRIHPVTQQGAFYFAGSSAPGTQTAASYLIREWSRLRKSYGDDQLFTEVLTSACWERIVAGSCGSLASTGDHGISGSDFEMFNP